jgi:integrase/recombinase XerD
MSERETYQDYIDKPVFEKFKDRMEGNRAENTWSNRKVVLRQYFEYYHGITIQSADKPPDVDCDYETILQYDPPEEEIKITNKIVEAWIDYLQKQEYASRSIQSKIYALSSFAQFCEQEDIGHIDFDVSETDADQMTGNKIDTVAERRYLTKEEFDKMMDAEEGHIRNRLLLKLMFDTGIRASEVTSIKLKDFDKFDERKIEVVNAKQSELSEGTETREVYYTKYFDIILTKWRNGKRDDYMYTGTEKDEGHLLVTKQQPKMGIGRVNQIVKEVAEKAGVQQNSTYTDVAGRERKVITSHTLRSTFAVLRVKQNISLYYLMNLLGHESIDITVDRYLHHKKEDIKNAYENTKP